MKKSILMAIALLSCTVLRGQSFDVQKEEGSLSYGQGKSAVIEKFKHEEAGNFGEGTRGIMTKIVSSKKIVA